MISERAVSRSYQTGERGSLPAADLCVSVAFRAALRQSKFWRFIYLSRVQANK